MLSLLTQDENQISLSCQWIETATHFLDGRQNCMQCKQFSLQVEVAHTDGW